MKKNMGALNMSPFMRDIYEYISNKITSFLFNPKSRDKKISNYNYDHRTITQLSINSYIANL